jgi:ribose transport system ATP-binding protein
LALRRGEILGVAGLTGAGRTELARGLCGLDPVHAGRVELAGEELPPADYPVAVARGLVYLSEDRKNDGLFLRLSVALNLVSTLTARHSRAGLYRGAGDAGTVAAVMERLQVVASSPDTDVGNLSGGNQQKVLLGKWLAMQPLVLILDEPSRGVDVNAKMRIHQEIMALADAGAGVLLISSDLPELVGLADRMIVMRNGRLLGELPPQAVTEESVLLAANGHGNLRSSLNCHEQSQKGH